MKKRKLKQAIKLLSSVIEGNDYPWKIESFNRQITFLDDLIDLDSSTPEQAIKLLKSKSIGEMSVSSYYEKEEFDRQFEEVTGFDPELADDFTEGNTYNDGSPLVVKLENYKFGSTWFHLVSVPLGGDVRGNYSVDYVIKSDYEFEIAQGFSVYGTLEFEDGSYLSLDAEDIEAYSYTYENYNLKGMAQEFVDYLEENNMELNVDFLDNLGVDIFY
jgi:hypothetical protein